MTEVEKHILFEGVLDGILVGGGTACFDGGELYLGDYSGDFGPMTEAALRQIFPDDSVVLSLG